MKIWETPIKSREVDNSTHLKYCMHAWKRKEKPHMLNSCINRKQKLLQKSVYSKKKVISNTLKSLLKNLLGYQKEVVKIPSSRHKDPWNYSLHKCGGKSWFRIAQCMHDLYTTSMRSRNANAAMVSKGFDRQHVMHKRPRGEWGQVLACRLRENPYVLLVRHTFQFF